MRCMQASDVITSVLVIGTMCFCVHWVSIGINNVLLGNWCAAAERAEEARTACALRSSLRPRDVSPTDVGSRVQLARADAHFQGPLHNANDGPRYHAEDATEYHPFHI